MLLCQSKPFSHARAHPVFEFLCAPPPPPPLQQEEGEGEDEDEEHGEERDEQRWRGRTIDDGGGRRKTPSASSDSDSDERHERDEDADPFAGIEMACLKTYLGGVALLLMYSPGVGARSVHVAVVDCADDASAPQPLLDTYFPDLSTKVNPGGGLCPARRARAAGSNFGWLVVANETFSRLSLRAFLWCFCCVALIALVVVVVVMVVVGLRLPDTLLSRRTAARGWMGRWRW